MIPKRFWLHKILVGAMVSVVFSYLFLLSSAPVALATPPAAPTGLSVDVNTSPGSAILNWTGSAGATHYRVYRSLNTITDANRYSAMLVAGSVSGTTYTDSTAIRGETYYWTVSAANASNEESSVATNVTATVGSTEDPHGSYTTTTNLCKDCHSVHAATGTVKIYRKATQREVCYTCHDGTGSTNQNIQAQTSKSSKHPVGDTAVSPRTATLECINCHSPHRVTTPRHTAPGNSASGVLTAVWGVEPNPWPTPNVQPRNIPAFPGSTITLAGGVTLIKAGNYFYAFSGGSVRFWRYNPSNNAWQLMADAPGAVANGAALVHTGGDYIYAFQGGSTAFWRYQISTDTWNPGGAPTVAPANTGAGGSLAYAGGNYIFAFQGGTAAFWVYSIPNNNWTTLDPPDTPGSAATGAGASLAWDGGNYVFAFRGNTQAAFWAYSIPNNNWTTLDPPDTPSGLTVGAGGSLCYPGSGDYIYALRGGTQTTFWAYSKANNNWSTLDPADAPAAIGTNSGNRLAYDGSDYIYCLRGETNGEFWRYKISTNLWNDGQAAPSAYTVVNPVQKEYQLCLKCHSNYSSSPVGPQPAGQMNLAEAINPMSVSHHPIAGPAANRYCDQDTMEAPWNQYDWDTGTAIDDTHNVMYCSDCHGSDANNLASETNTPTDPLGPHGSNNSKILRAPIASDSTNGTPLCFICHKLSMYWSGTEVEGINGTRFSEHPIGRGNHKVAAGCLLCHIGGSSMAGAKAASNKEYIHGSNFVQEVDSTNRGPAHAFLYGDGILYIRQVDLDCWTGPSGYGVCGTQHNPRDLSAPAP